jgi:putative thioredoxin
MSAHVIDVNESTFQDQVVQACMAKPIIIDFWATWCGPCKQLGPILEDFAEQYGGAFTLAKIDVDRNPQLAAHFQAQSVPMVLALYQGQVVTSFAGAQPKSTVKEFIDDVLSRCGVEAPPSEASVPTDPLEAEAHWRAKVASDADDGGALLELGRLLLTQGREGEARESLSAVTARMNEYNAAQAVLSLIELYNEVTAAGGEALVRDRRSLDPEDREAAYLIACADGVRGEFASALDTLVTLFGTRGVDPDLKVKVQQASSTIFEVAGRGDDEVEALRRRLTQLLF